MMPKPNSEEIVVWRHSGRDPKPGVNLSEIASDPRVKKVNIAFYMIFPTGALIWFTRPGVLEYLISVRFLIEILSGVLLLYFGPKLIAKVTEIFEKDNKPENTAIPLWMSEERLAFSSGDVVVDDTLNLNDILSTTPGFAEGAPSLALSLRNRTIIIMSSEINILKKHLYSIRPDLEPTS